MDPRSRVTLARHRATEFGPMPCFVEIATLRHNGIHCCDGWLRERLQRLSGGADVGVTPGVVAELALAEKAFTHGRSPLRARRIRRQADFLRALDKGSYEREGSPDFVSVEKFH